LGEIGIFQFFRVHFPADVVFSAVNEDWYVSLRGMGNVGKKKTSKKEHKLGIN